MIRAKRALRASFISIVVQIAITSIARAGATPASVSIEGAVDKPTQWTTTQLQEQFSAKIKVVEYESHGQKHTSTCVPLISMLESAGVPIVLKMDPTADPKTKHRALRLVVLAEARDGYAVAFSVAEMLPDIGGKEVWVAIDQDGKPLADKDAPVKLVVLADGKPARWIHAVVHLTVTELKVAAATQP